MNSIVNCCGRDINNKWGNFGISYFTINWRDIDAQVIFPEQSQVMTKAFNFIDSALQKGNSVLVHSNRGQSRSGCIILSYLMQKYSWSVNKSLSFLQTRKPNIRLRQNFIRQLHEFEENLKIKNNISLSEYWDGSFTYINRPGK